MTLPLLHVCVTHFDFHCSLSCMVGKRTNIGIIYYLYSGKNPNPVLYVFNLLFRDITASSLLYIPFEVA